MHTQRTLILLGVAAGTLAVCLDWIIEFDSYSDFPYYLNAFHFPIGHLYFALSIAAGALSIIGDWKKSLTGIMKATVFLSAVLAFFCTLYFFYVSIENQQYYDFEMASGWKLTLLTSPYIMMVSLAFASPTQNISKNTTPPLRFTKPNE